MTRAEKAAMEAYPPKFVTPKRGAKRIQSEKVDTHAPTRAIYRKGYEKAEKDTIERACKWLFAHLPILVYYYDEDVYTNADRSEFIKQFRTQMEDEK